MTDNTANSPSQPPAPFRATYIHAYLAAVRDLLIGRIAAPRPESLLVLVGPSHVGKSTAVALVKHHLIKQYAEDMAADPSFAPFAGAELIWERKIGVSFKDLYGTLLHSLAEEMRPEYTGKSPGREDGTTDRRRRLACVLRSRKTKAIFLDEAQQLCAGTNGRTAVENLRALKNLAVIVKIPIILSATYELLEYVGVSPEIEARTTILHFPPYSDPKCEGKHFADVIAWAERQLHVRYPAFSFSGQAFEGLLAACGGRVGILMRWLANSETDCWPTQDRDLAYWLRVNAPSPARTQRLGAEDFLGTRLLGNLTSKGFNGILSPKHRIASSRS